MGRQRWLRHVSSLCKYFNINTLILTHNVQHFGRTFLHLLSCVWTFNLITYAKQEMHIWKISRVNIFMWPESWYHAVLTETKVREKQMFNCTLMSLCQVPSEGVQLAVTREGFGFGPWKLLWATEVTVERVGWPVLSSNHWSNAKVSVTDYLLWAPLPPHTHTTPTPNPKRKKEKRGSILVLSLS